LISYIKNFFFILAPKDKISLLKIFFLHFISTFFEVLTIGLIIPIISLFLDIGKFTSYIEKSSYFNNIFRFLLSFSQKELLFFTLLLFLFVYILKTLFLIFYQNQKFNFLSESHDLVVNKMYKNYLNKNYIFHLSNNSSTMIRNITQDCNIFSFSITPAVIHLITEVLKVILIVSVLIFYSPVVTIILFSVLSFLILFFYKLTSYKLKTFGLERQYYSAKIIQKLQEGFKSIKEIIIYNMQDIFLNEFSAPNKLNSFFRSKSELLTSSLKPLVELCVVILFLIIIFLALNINYENSNIVLFIALFSFSFSKMLPSYLLITKSLADLRYNYSTIKLISSELKNFINPEIKKNKKIDDIFKIELKNIYYNYSGSKKLILEDINFEAQKNDKIAIIGSTGAGKTTLINIITGLLQSERGDLLINEKLYHLYDYFMHHQIAYVPQSPAILEETILFNITLKNFKSDFILSNVIESLKIVQLYDFINNLENGIDTLLGENGANLSGGQCQRLAIARAIYRNPSVLILDESTNAIDDNTENLILDNINKKFYNKIVINVSHKKNILNFCNKIYKIENKKIYLIK
jgi:ABC-type multidrug transport system fused ATPase/permease subunit